ncbi:MAG TPA: hypothetical protein VEC19_11545 [Usitatibacter sp.]|nr:hypothetical protein [Usitatibacter sp.]
MTIHLDHTIVPAKERDKSAQLLARILGVKSGPASAGPFYEVYLNENTTLDFIQADEAFPVYHFCFRVEGPEFQAILGRLSEAGIPYRSQVRGLNDGKVDPTYGNVYWNEPEGHMWEILQVSYARPKS